MGDDDNNNDDDDNKNDDDDNKSKKLSFQLSSSRSNKKKHQAVAAGGLLFGGDSQHDVDRKNDDPQQHPQHPHPQQLVIPVAPDKNKLKQWKQQQPDLPPTAAAAVSTTTTMSREDCEALEKLQQEAADHQQQHQHQQEQKASSSTTIPMYGGNSSISSNEKTGEAALFQKDLQDLPDELALDDYQKPNAVPISQFGAALLRGMGWKGDDNNDGNDDTLKNKKKKDEEEALLMLPRPHRLGLGAVPSAASTIQKIKTNPNKILRPDQVKQQERLQKQLQLFSNQQELQKKQLRAQDKQATMQNGSIVWLLSSSTSTSAVLRENDHDTVHRVRARVLQLVGVPGLNKVRVQVEGSTPNSSSSSVIVVSRGNLGSLVPRSELEAEPFVVEDTTPTADNNQHHHLDDHESDDDGDDDARKKKKRAKDHDRRSRDDDVDDKVRKKKKRDDTRDEDRRSRRRRYSDSSSSSSSSTGYDDSDDDDDSRRRRHSHRRDKNKDKKKRKRSSREEQDDDRSSHKKDKKKRSRHDSKDDDNNNAEDVSWLMPHIRVRVITTKFGKQHFQQKGVVVDVTPRGATLRMDGGGGGIVLDHVSARYLTTALPKVNGCAVVVAEQKKHQEQGLHYKGARGIVLQRDANQVVLQLHEDHTVLTLPLDDLAEWCGPRDDDEYY